MQQTKSYIHFVCLLCLWWKERHQIIALNQLHILYLLCIVRVQSFGGFHTDFSQCRSHKLTLSVEEIASKTQACICCLSQNLYHLSCMFVCSCDNNMVRCCTALHTVKSISQFISMKGIFLRFNCYCAKSHMFNACALLLHTKLILFIAAKLRCFVRSRISFSFDLEFLFTKLY